MEYVGFEQIVVPNSVRHLAHLTVPPSATHVEIQADTQNVRYRMDGNNPTGTVGMLFVANAAPKTFDMNSLQAIRFIQAAAGARLNFHYFRGGSV
jgi:hypothetical protein